jgi:hypothetical protein
MKTLLAVAFTTVIALGAPAASAEDAKPATVAALHQDKAALGGQLVRVEGKVVKVNNGIMGRNFVHVQDGTGGTDSNNLIVTSKQTAAVGDRVVATGRVVLNRDFGSGYLYPLLLEDTELQPAN